MLVPHRLRLLTLDPRDHPRDHPRGAPHLSAASGIVCIGHKVYVVADDEHHLACLEAGDVATCPIQLVRFMPGELPAQKADRKKRKPDIEVLLHLPAQGPGEGGVLLLLGSGSRRQRERVFAFDLQPDGAIASGPREVAAAPFYAPLHDQFDALNLEAGYAEGGLVHLFQRANGGHAINGRITYDAGAFSAWVRGRAVQPPQPVGVLRFSLGSHASVPFGITDAAGWSRSGCVFTAVAEDTADAYRDGACVASVVGWMDADGHVRSQALLSGAPKVEGVAPVGEGRLWLVTDADDPDRPSELLELAWSP